MLLRSKVDLLLIFTHFSTFNDVFLALMLTVAVVGLFDPLNQVTKGPAPPLEQKSDDRFTIFLQISYCAGSLC
jgi:hypothetical protein